MIKVKIVEPKSEGLFTFYKKDVGTRVPYEDDHEYFNEFGIHLNPLYRTGKYYFCTYCRRIEPISELHKVYKLYRSLYGRYYEYNYSCHACVSGDFADWYFECDDCHRIWSAEDYNTDVKIHMTNLNKVVCPCCAIKYTYCPDCKAWHKRDTSEIVVNGLDYLEEVADEQHPWEF